MHIFNELYDPVFSFIFISFGRDEFWDLYKSHFHQRLLLGDLRICLYGPLPTGIDTKRTKKEARDWKITACSSANFEPSVLCM